MPSNWPGLCLQEDLREDCDERQQPEPKQAASFPLLHLSSCFMPRKFQKLRDLGYPWPLICGLGSLENISDNNTNLWARTGRIWTIVICKCIHMRSCKEKRYIELKSHPWSVHGTVQVNETNHKRKLSKLAIWGLQHNTAYINYLDA